MKKETILELVIMINVIVLIILVGLVVLNNVSQDVGIAKCFCIDKEGLHNIIYYGYEFDNLLDTLNCSNKENPTGIDTALSVY